MQRDPIDVWIDKIWDDSFIRAENNYCAHLNWYFKSFQDTVDIAMVKQTRSTREKFCRQCDRYTEHDAEYRSQKCTCIHWCLMISFVMYVTTHFRYLWNIKYKLNVAVSASGRTSPTQLKLNLQFNDVCARALNTILSNGFVCLCACVLMLAHCLYYCFNFCSSYFIHFGMV